MKINSNKIRILVSEKGLNYTQFSAIAGISRAWFSNILQRGEATPAMLTKMAVALDVPVQELLEERI